MKIRKTRKITTKHPGHQLFNDSPRGRPRTRGIHYGTAKGARESIQKIKNKPRAYQMQVAITMYYRAKYHKFQTDGMRDAMNVWGNYIQKLKG